MDFLPKIGIEVNMRFSIAVIIKTLLDSETDNFAKNQINFSFIGDIGKFDSLIREKLYNLQKATSSFKNFFYLSLRLWF